jgi:hypothetical protein
MEIILLIAAAGVVALGSMCWFAEAAIRRQQANIMSLAKRAEALEADVAYYKDEANQLGWMVDELKKFVIECSVCHELLPAGVLYTTQYPRDADGRMTGGEPKYTCESCERARDEESNDGYPWDDSTMDGLDDAPDVTCESCGSPAWGDGPLPYRCSECMAAAIGATPVTTPYYSWCGEDYVGVDHHPVCADEEAEAERVYAVAVEQN